MPPGDMPKQTKDGGGVGGSSGGGSGGSGSTLHKALQLRDAEGGRKSVPREGHTTCVSSLKTSALKTHIGVILHAYTHAITMRDNTQEIKESDTGGLEGGNGKEKCCDYIIMLKNVLRGRNYRSRRQFRGS